jgi:hypothetical protein
MLKLVLKIHSLAAAAYAVVLLFVPSLFCQLTTKDPSTDYGLAMTQLFGAPMVLMTLLTWFAAGLDDRKSQHRIACFVLLYLCTGLTITLIQQLSGKWGAGGWSSPLSYACFAALYTVALLRKTDARSLPRGRAAFDAPRSSATGSG